MKRIPFWIWSLVLGAAIGAATFFIPETTASAYPWTVGLPTLAGGIAWINAASESLIHTSETLSSRNN